MQDKEINRRFIELQQRVEKIENTKPGEPVMGSELDKTLRRIETTGHEIKTELSTLKERVDNHIKFFWAAVVLSFTLFGTAGGYIYTQHGRLTRLEAALPTAQIADAIAGPLNAQKVEKIQKVVAEAKKSGARIEPEALAKASRELIQSSAGANPQVAEAAWKTVSGMVDYRTSLNAIALPVLSVPPESPQATRYDTPVRPGRPFPIVSVIGQVPIGQSAVLEEIGANLNKSLTTGNQYAIVQGGSILLNGLEMKHVILQGVTVSYDGGPLRMSDVYFVNCSFEISNQKQGQDLALALLQSPVTTFSAS